MPAGGLRGRGSHARRCVAMRLLSSILCSEPIMAQRGRKPAALRVLPFVPGQGGRPPPPAEFDAIEARIWRAVGALPAFWVDPAGEQVLRSIAALGAIQQRREARLRALRAADQDIGKEVDKLTAAHRVAAKVLADLLCELRATPRARFTARASAPVIADTPKLRPWEIRAGGKAG